MVRSRGEKLRDLLVYAAMVVLALIFLAPILWLVSLSLRTQSEVFLGAARFIPNAPTLDNFARLLRDGGFQTYIWNTVKLSALGALGAVAFAAPAAYALSRMAFRGKGALMLAVLSVQMVSGLVVLIPLYRFMDSLGLLESQFGTTPLYIAAGIPVTIWLLKIAFDTVPQTLHDAAAIDGLSRFESFALVTLPLAMPGLMSAFILNLILNWSQFLIPFIMLSDDSTWPISVAIFRYAGATNAATTQLLAAACLLAILPALVLFVALQRWVMAALMAGAVKE